MNFNNLSRSTSGILSPLTMKLGGVEMLKCHRLMFDQCRNEGANDLVWFLDWPWFTVMYGLPFKYAWAFFPKCLMEASNLGCFCSDWYLEWLLAVPCAGGIIAPLNYRWVCVIPKCSHISYCLKCHLQFMQCFAIGSKKWITLLPSGRTQCLCSYCMSAFEWRTCLN